MATQTNILTAIFTRLNGFALPIQWPNIKFTIPDNKKWLEIKVIPNETQAPNYGDEKVALGIIRAGVISPPDIGIFDALGYCETIAALFPKNLILFQSTTRIEFPFQPSIGPEIQDNNQLILPVTIRYRSYER